MSAQLVKRIGCFHSDGDFGVMTHLTQCTAAILARLVLAHQPGLARGVSWCHVGATNTDDGYHGKRVTDEQRDEQRGARSQ